MSKIISSLSRKHILLIYAALAFLTLAVFRQVENRALELNPDHVEAIRRWANFWPARIKARKLSPII